MTYTYSIVQLLERRVSRLLLYSNRCGCVCVCVCVFGWNWNRMRPANDSCNAVSTVCVQLSMCVCVYRWRALYKFSSVAERFTLHIALLLLVQFRISVRFHCFFSFHFCRMAFRVSMYWCPTHIQCHDVWMRVRAVSSVSCLTAISHAVVYWIRFHFFRSFNR